jgi:hypothetical protein
MLLKAVSLFLAYASAHFWKYSLLSPSFVRYAEASGYQNP